MLDNKKVLVTYGWCRNSWAVLRNLTSHGLTVYAGDTSKTSMAGSSKYCEKSFTYPSFYQYPDLFIDRVVDFILQNKIGTYIPIHEEIMVVAKNLKKFPEDIRIPISSYENIYNQYNKAELAKIAKKLDIPIPKTFFLKSIEDLDDFAGKIPYQAIIKLQNSNGAKGIKIVSNEHELKKEYLNLIHQFNIIDNLPIIQEYVHGTMYAVSLLFDQGKRKACFVRQNIREKDYFGGTCTKCKSVHHDKILDYASKILEYSKFTGVAMFEFKVSEDNNNVWLIESNPRYWGTISHDIDCGVEFPYYHYCIANGIDFDAQVDYQDEIISRWIIGDLISLMNTTKKSKNKFRNIRKYFLFDDKFYMDFKIDDPVPFFSQLYYYLKKFIKYRTTNPIEEGMIY